MNSVIIKILTRITIKVLVAAKTIKIVEKFDLVIFKFLQFFPFFNSNLFTRNFLIVDFTFFLILQFFNFNKVVFDQVKQFF